MAPVLLDQRRLFQLFSGFVLGLVLAFSAGYLTAMRANENALQPVAERVALALPEPSVDAAARIDPVVPAVVAPGAEIDVDVPDAPVAAKPAPVSTQPTTESAAPEVETEHKPGSDVKAASASASEPDTVAEHAPAPAAGLAIGGPASDATDDDPRASMLIVDDATAEDALYSIQVGIYGSFNNARRQVGVLSEQKLSAWLDEYQNKDNQTRYNVRFGYFASRASAVAALEAWQTRNSPQSSHGYVVRLSR